MLVGAGMDRAAAKGNPASQTGGEQNEVRNLRLFVRACSVILEVSPVTAIGSLPLLVSTKVKPFARSPASPAAYEGAGTLKGIVEPALAVIAPFLNGERKVPPP